MKRRNLPFVGLALVVGWFVAVPVRETAALASPPAVPSNRPAGQLSEELEESRREVSPTPEVPAPLIGFIDSPGASCHQPNPAQNICYLNWYYLNVDAAPNYMVSMEVSINQRVVAHYRGFFQTSMYIPSSMMSPGFRVVCGSLGQGGVPELGRRYSYKITAKDSANLTATNYGTSYCPAFRGAIPNTP